MTVHIHNPVHSLVANKGAMVWLPRSPIAPNLATPDVYAQTATQLYALGAKLEYADGRVFRYCRFGETATTPCIARFVCNANLCPGATGGSVYGYEGTLDAASDVAIGSTTLITNDVTDRVENFYEDGMFASFPSGHYVEYRIAGNEAAASVDDVTIYLDDPAGLRTLHVVNSTGITTYPSMFSEVQYMPASGYETAVGMYLGITMTDTYHGWVQRRGRAIVTPTAYFGDNANERMAQLHSDGTIALKAAYATQTVGYLTQRTQSDYGDLEIWLTLE